MRALITLLVLPAVMLWDMMVARPFHRLFPAKRWCECEWPGLTESMKGLLCPRCGWPRRNP
jgi:hypothetical protein